MLTKKWGLLHRFLVTPGVPFGWRDSFYSCPVFVVCTIRMRFLEGLEHGAGVDGWLCFLVAWSARGGLRVGWVRRSLGYWLLGDVDRMG